MRVPQETLDLIKSRVRLSDMIGRTVKLKKAGKSWRGLSPFSSEKTPSFLVHDHERFWKCFSTQKGGDCFTWLVDVERMTFPEAVRHLAELTGVLLADATPAEVEAERERKRLLDLVAWAQSVFSTALHQSPEARPARDYMRKRGITGDSCRTHGVGYAKSAGFLDLAHASGWGVGELEAAGLVRRSDDGRPYPMFRERITLPVHDQAGRPIGFTARALLPDQQPKYVNSPDTQLFHKGASLFGLPHARDLMRKQDSLFVVEGCFDSTGLRDFGIPAVAPLGTAMTADQLALCWRLTESPVICTDGDAAGKAAAIRVAHMALPLLRLGRSLRFCFMPHGHDPDSMLRAFGSTALADALARQSAHFAVIFDDLRAGLDLSDPGDAGRMRMKCRKMLDAITDPETRLEWKRAFLRRLGMEGPAPQPLKPDRDKPRRASVERKRERITALVEPEATAALLLAALYAEPPRVDAHAETLAGLPCGRFAPIKEWLLEDDPTRADALLYHVTELAGRLPAPTSYTAAGWERAARALIARYPLA